MSKSVSSINDEPSRRTILLVEDEPFVREATYRILEKAGFYVLTAADAADAISVFEQCPRPVDLVMTDLVLPGCSGQQLGKDIRRRSAHLKLLVTSGYSDAESDVEDPSTHTYFLAKPYSRHSLVEKIERILNPQPPWRTAACAS